MKYTLIEEKGQYALILRGESMTQYAVVCGLDQETGSWDWTCCYYDFGKFLWVCDGAVKRNVIQRHIRNINNHIPRIEFVGLEYLVVLTGAKCQEVIERMALLEL